MSFMKQERHISKDYTTIRLCIEYDIKWAKASKQAKSVCKTKTILDHSKYAGDQIVREVDQNGGTKYVVYPVSIKRKEDILQRPGSFCSHFMTQ